MENRIEELIKKMTLAEKASLCSGGDTWHLKGVERLGIPRTMVSDGPHGLRKQEEQADNLGIYDSVKAVCFPAACAGACSFDTNLMEKLGDLLGRECRAEDVSVLLGPAVNTKRSPLGGRNFEYFSEDPYLTGKLAAAYIRGVQRHNVGTSVKHFAANNQESMRQTVSVEVSERALREIYLRAFEIVVKEAKPWTVMCSYNRLRGTYASENRELLTDILRDEWGFEGYVMSDWGAVNDRVKGLAAGLDLEMPSSGGRNDRKIVEAVEQGALKEEVLDRAVRRILNAVLRFAENAKKEKGGDYREEHHGESVEMACECAVLLKNEGVLPLTRDKRIAYIGPYAKTPRYQGGGSSHINAYRVSGALEAARKEGLAVSYCEGFTENGEDGGDVLLEEAVRLAGEADCAVIFAGLPETYESEGYDRSHMRLPKAQDRLIEAVCAVQKNTVVALHNGSPVEMPWADVAAAVLELYLGGEGAGEAAHLLLYGDRNPCGKLAETFPIKLEDNPSFLNFPGQERTVRYAEDIYIGYRYYEKKKMPVRFPFGHGLSYTRFAYKNMRLSRDVMEKEDTVTVSVDVENTGDRAGKEIVQLYVAGPGGAGGAPRPEKELKGFAKVELQPGECRTVSFPLNFRSLAWYSESLGGWYAEPGVYRLFAAASSADIRTEASITYKSGETLPFTVDRYTTVGELLKDGRTAGLMRRTLGKLAAATGSMGLSGMSGETLRKMAENLPLLSVQSFMGMSDEAFEEFLGEGNRLICGEENV